VSAVIKLMEWNGPVGSPTQTDKTSSELRFKFHDDPIVDASYPLLSSRKTIRRSFEKWLRIHVGRPGPDNTLFNLVAYRQGVLSNIWVRSVNPASWEYAAPAVPADETGCVPFGQFWAARPKSLDSSTSGAPYRGYDFDAGDFLVLHATIAAGAPPSMGIAISAGGVVLGWTET
jgi:hypothetical protein